MREVDSKTKSARLHDDLWVPYQRRTNLVECIKEDDRFYAGEQWGSSNPTNMPRVTLNIIAKGVNIIASKIAGTPLWLTFAASSEETDCLKLRTFDEAVRKMLNLDTFSYRSYVNGESRGTEITYVSWDEENESIGGFFTGGLRFKHISPLNFAVANPHEPDVQRQQWVMTWTDVAVSHLRSVLGEEGYSKSELAEKNGLLDSDAKRSRGLNPDDPNVDRDLINSTLIRVYLRFFRIKGEVVYTLETEHCVISKLPKPLSTSVSVRYAEEAQKALDKAEKGTDENKDMFILDYEMDSEDSIVDMPHTRNSAEKHRKRKRKFSLYPFAIYTPIPIDDSIFGSSKTKQMIPLQKVINFDISMVAMAAQNNAYNKIFVKQGAIRQRITNEPGQVITDYSQNPNSWGIKFAESQPMPNDVTNHVQFLISAGESTYGFNDTLQGNITNQDASGYMLQQAIREANTPIEQEQKLAWKYQKDLALLRIMFYEHYLSETYYSWDYTDGEIEEQERYRSLVLKNAMNPAYGTEGFGGNAYSPNGTLIPAEELIARYNKPTKKTQVEKFNPQMLWGVDFEIIVDAQQGLADSKIAEQQAWDSLILNGSIQNLSADQLELYIKGNPSFTPAFRSEVTRYVEQLKHSELQAQRQQIAQLTQAVTQLQQQLQAAGVTAEEMQKEFTSKIQAANRYTQMLTQDNDRLRRAMPVTGQGNPIEAQPDGISEGERKSNNARGISGSSM